MFRDVLLPSIIFDVEQANTAYVLNEYLDILAEGHRRGGWPSFYDPEVGKMVRKISSEGLPFVHGHVVVWYRWLGRRSINATRIRRKRRTKRCNRAAKSGVLKWMVNGRRRLIGNVTRLRLIKCESDPSPSVGCSLGSRRCFQRWRFRIRH